MDIQKAIHFLNPYQPSQYHLSMSITSLISVWLHVIITSIQYTENGETAMKVVKRNVLLRGFVCFLFY